MKYLPRDLTNELKIKYESLRNHFDYSSIIKCKKIAYNKMKKTVHIHSYRIEHPCFGVPFSVPRNNKKRDVKKGIKNIENAFNWGINHFNPSTFNESFIRELAGKITPELYEGEIANYREHGVTITGASITPPYPFKLINYEIPEFIDSLKKQLSCEDIINRIETSIFAHLQIARIHPFSDGNGRTARTLQDVILYHYGIPIPLIEAGERYAYYNYLDKAVYDLDVRKAEGGKNGATEGERLFYTFIARKINTSLDKILEKYNC